MKPISFNADRSNAASDHIPPALGDRYSAPIEAEAAAEMRLKGEESLRTNPCPWPTVGSVGSAVTVAPRRRTLCPAVAMLGESGAVLCVARLV